ncbi:CRISPR-associated helicase Cas3' [Coriobacteriales bacterium OH1046]|nr:CRISPR-associated helicase Cas3' [Coriobacteriales bacterium OH1046]
MENVFVWDFTTGPVSHISEDGRIELVATHLREVADMAEHFASETGLAGLDRYARTAGAYHDLGKYSNAFQERILRDGPKIDHSTAGAYDLITRNRNAWPLSYCVAGHHGGLPDGGVKGEVAVTLVGRLNKMEGGYLPSYEAWRSDPALEELLQVDITSAIGLSADIPTGIDRSGFQCFSLSFMIRMIFSCLVDADFLCTERFTTGSIRPRPTEEPLEVLLSRLEEKLRGFYPPGNELNKLRCKVLDDCGERSKDTPGIFTLTVPTGGGKTLSVARFALKHAVEHGMRRVIVAEPYTSIIEQNAQVYREILGEGSVLEHHSNHEFHDDDDPKARTMSLASENWDVPVVVTTNVQLFESFFASSTSRARKLHNIARSVIVLDEAQMLPIKYLYPCIRSLVELVRNYGCSVVLCTATQPSLNRYFEEWGLSVREIVRDEKTLSRALRRVDYQNIGYITDSELAEMLAGHHQVLCIVNSRKQARSLYGEVAALCGDDSTFHLTTLMHPAHRQRTLTTIRRYLQEDAPCRVIATSLVEAGVDLDFPAVFRALAGLDSIVQAGGRCNREGKNPALESIVRIFEPISDGGDGGAYCIPSEIMNRIGAVRPLLENNGVATFDSLETIQAYYDRLYKYRGDRERNHSTLDEKGIIEYMSKAVPQETNKGRTLLSFPFAKVGADFQLIESPTCDIVVPSDEVAGEVGALRAGCAMRRDMRRLGRHTVHIYQDDLKRLNSIGALTCIEPNLFVLDDPTLYSEKLGLSTAVSGGNAMCF